MATFFEMIGRVLDESYAEISEKDKDKVISSRLSDLSKRYGDVLSKGDSILMHQ
jgi:hypothetical protein